MTNFSLRFGFFKRSYFNLSWSFAWYQAAAVYTVKYGSDVDLTVTTKVNENQNLDVYGKFTLSAVEDQNVKMTSGDGYMYYVDSSNVLYKEPDANQTLTLGTQYGSATWSVEFYREAACTTKITAASEISSINGTVNLTVTAGSRSRVATTAPSALGHSAAGDFGTVFGSSLGNPVNVSVEITSGAISTNPTIYWAVNGHKTTLLYSDTATTGLDALVGRTIGADYNDGGTGISENITVSANNS